MTDTLFDPKEISIEPSTTPLGDGLLIRVTEGFPQKAFLSRHGTYIKSVELADKTAMRLFVVEAVELGATQSRLAKALGLSRQTIHNYLAIQKHYGREGLVHGYSATKGSRLREERKKHSGKRRLGNKAREVAAIRRSAMEEAERVEAERQPHLNYSFGDGSGGEMEKGDLGGEGVMADEGMGVEEMVTESASGWSGAAAEIGAFGDGRIEEGLAVGEELKETAEEPSEPGASPGEEIGTQEAVESATSTSRADDGGDEVPEVPADAAKSAAKAAVEPGGMAALRAGEELFNEEHDWQSTRYAGVFGYLIALISDWKWLQLVLGHFGKHYPIFSVFLLMSARNIRSLEQLKHVRIREAGLLLGLGQLPSRTKIWEWFYQAARLRVSRDLLFDFFRYQIHAGLVSIYAWFTDGHLLPYTGKERVHKAFNTQRQMPEPGQTNLVSCDGGGRVVDFEIQEGKGNLRSRISALFRKWSPELPASPVMVFDREGCGGEFFLGLIREKIPFVTWEKHLDKEALAAIADHQFTHRLELNGKEYGLFEGEKSLVVDWEEAGEAKSETITLSRIYLWNKTTKSRTCGLSWSGDQPIRLEDRAHLLLSRWGASENTFKHLQNQHPFHYRPGFSFSESADQELANPEIKEKQQLIARTQTQINKRCRVLAHTREILKKDGTPRKNSTRQRLEQEIKELESKVARFQEEKRQLPETIKVSSLADYKSFKTIDNEGKNLFDFVTASVWNARKEMVGWLRPCFDREEELVDLFYAITDCHGWIKSTPREVTVRLEPLQQPKRRMAQEQLCRKLTGRAAQLPNGKWLSIEVGPSPCTR